MVFECLFFSFHFYFFQFGSIRSVFLQAGINASDVQFRKV